MTRYGRRLGGDLGPLELVAFSSLGVGKLGCGADKKALTRFIL